MGTVIHVEMLMWGLLSSCYSWLPLGTGVGKVETSSKKESGVRILCLTPCIIRTWFNAIFSGEEQHVPCLAASLNILLGCADSITGYTVDDNNQTMTRMYLALIAYCIRIL